jgi:hypothetical protein
MNNANSTFKTFGKKITGIVSLLAAWKCTQIASSFLNLHRGASRPAPGTVVHNIYYWNGIKIEDWGLIAIPVVALILALLLGGLGFYLLALGPLHQSRKH